MNEYLIPANSKKSMLYFGVFNKTDLIIFCVGVGITLILLPLLPVQNLLIAAIALAPGVVAATLVIPIPNYHNIRTIIKLAYEFYTTRRQFVWKGWYKDYGEKQNSKK